MIWEELIKTALLGTERTEISESLKTFLGTVELSESAGSSEKRLLELISVYTPIKKTFISDVRIEIEKPKRIADERINNNKITKSLNVMLGGIYVDAFPAFFRLLSKKKMTLPLSSLPELFEKSLINPTLWEQIKLILGESGKWLLHKNPNWELLWQKTDKIDWVTASKFKRLQVLSQIRASKTPEKAIQKLTSTWTEENWKTKVDFLKKMIIGLSLKDEFFLEECLNEGRKEVRQSAAKLLVKIPSSKISINLFNFVNLSFLFKRGKLEVKMPEEIDERFSPLLDFSKNKTDLKRGLITNSFAQLFSKIPAEKWEKRFEGESAQVFKIFLRSNEKEILIENLTYGLKENHSDRWAANLLNLWLAGTHNLKFEDWKIEELVQTLSVKTFNKIALLHIGENEELRGEHSKLLKYLQNSTQDWDEDLALRVLLPLKKHISQLQGFDWSAWHYKEILKIAAYRISPNLSNRFLEGWESQGSGWEMWRFEIEQFLGCLKFRAEMHKAFNES